MTQFGIFFVEIFTLKTFLCAFPDFIGLKKIYWKFLARNSYFNWQFSKPFSRIYHIVLEVYYKVRRGVRRKRGSHKDNDKIEPLSKSP
jgi:hypothetical protein